MNVSDSSLSHEMDEMDCIQKEKNMQVKKIDQFRFDPNKKYRDARDRIADLRDFIFKHVKACPPHWVIMSPELISILMIPPTGTITVDRDTPGEYLLHPTETRVTANLTAANEGEMHAIVFPDYADGMYILNCGYPKDFIGDMDPGKIWGSNGQWVRII